MKKFILIVLVFGPLLGLVSLPILYPIAKQVRSQQHLKAAMIAKATGDDREALQKILSAYNLVKDNRRINAKLGPYAAAVYNPNALDWWTQAADDGELDSASLIEMIQYGFRINQADRVRPYLFELSQAFPGDQQVRALQLQFYQRERRPEETRVLAETLLEEGSSDVGVLASYLQATLAQPDLTPEERDLALAKLAEMSTAGGDLGIFSLRTLLRVWSLLSVEEKQRVGRELEQHPDCSLSDRLSLLSLQRADGAGDEAVLERARVAYASVSREEEIRPDRSTPLVAIFADWLNREGWSGVALEYLPAPKDIEDPRVFMVRQIALISSGDPAAARDASFIDNPLSPAFNFVLRAMALASLGEEEKVVPNLRLAVDNVRPNELGWLENVLRSTGQLDLITQMYENLSRSLANPVGVQLRLLAYYQALGRELEVQRVVQEIDLEQLGGLLTNQISALYNLLLYRYDFTDMRRHVEGLVTQFPELIEARVYLAFAYARSGQGGAAVELIEGWERFNLQQNRNLAVMLAVIYASAGQSDRAADLLANVDRSSLLDIERNLLSGV